MIRKLAILLPLALLAGCGTEQERCIRSNTKEYRVLTELLAETEANLSRGYAWKERDVSRMQMDNCTQYYHDSDGNLQTRFYSCWRNVIETERYRVPIDPEAETRSRDFLRAKLESETKRAESAVAQCKAAYPEAET